MVITAERASFESADLGESIPSSRLAWDGASAEQLAFMRAVYDRAVARGAARRPFVDDVPEAELSRRRPEPSRPS